MGDIGRLNPTGASQTSARGDNLPYSGVQASHKMAETDLPRMNQYKPIITTAARQFNQDPAVVAGIISRESRAGAGLSSAGTGDYGHAFGLMQIDNQWHTPRGGPYSLDHLMQATEILSDMHSLIRGKFPNWNADQVLQGALAAYNIGQQRVDSWHNIDAHTTHGDYSNDVIARAQFYRQRGY
ncbi:lysozyme g-like [Clavelina lepadiformis]|uniref:lysozyme g-like n=1 Tax=Clavelina lepadiformis TaxID=159417 RepID=UPI0040424112